MRIKLLFQTPNLKINLFVLMLSLFMSSFAQSTSRWCGSIESFEFTNGHETVSIENYGTYNLNELPDGFYVNASVNGYSQSLKYNVTNLDTDDSYQVVENILPYTFPAGNGAWNIGSGTFRVKANLYAFDHALGWSCDTEYIVFTLTDDNPCLADAGTLTATSTQVCSTGEVTISAHANGDAVVPEGYSVLYVLTQGEGLVIQQVGPSPEFTVAGGGDYTIHTLVYPNGLDLSIVELGVTTGFDVNGLLIQGGGELCASLDVAGAPVHITNPDAGTLTATESNVALSGGTATISATPNGDASVPEGYSTLYVLTQGESLTIVNVGGSPEFEVTEAGDYTIHTLVYPTGLDLSVVELGVTTGFDVNGLLVQGGGDLCAALDVPGAPVHVEEEAEECTAFAGTLKTYVPVVCINNGVATLSAIQFVPAVIPNGYEQIFVLTNAFNLTILNVSTTPEFEVSQVGFYRIHSLVYNPDTLDLGIVQLGTTTAFDVLPLLQQGGGDICASLDVRGAISLVLPRFFCHIFGAYFGKDTNSGSDVVNDWVNQYDSYENFEKDMLSEVTKTSVYPNPVKEDLNINTTLLENEIVNYSIIDMQGRLLKTGEISSMSNNKHQLNIGNLSNGTYIVQLNSEFRNFTTKIQVQR